MSSASIIGGGTFISTVNINQLVIGVNFHCRQANILISMDTSVLDPMTRGNLDNFKNQPIVTTYDNYSRYKDNHRVMFFNDYKWTSIAGLSSGLVAIAFCSSIGFKHLDLYGFTDLTNKDSDRYIKFNTLLAKGFTYTLHR